MTVPSISIAMATFNGAEFIGQQLDSLAAQDLPPVELVVADDGSTDATLQIVERFGRGAGFPVRVHRNATRLGYRGNFMQAARLCRGDLVAFCDQDDLWYPQKLAVCAAAFDDPAVKLVHHDADVIGPDGRLIGALCPRFPGGAPGGRPAARPPLTHTQGFSQIFDRSLLHFSDLWASSLDPHRGGESMAHDQWFFFLASALGGVVSIESRLVGYRQHSANVVGWGHAGAIKALLIALDGRARKFAAHAEAAQRCAAVLDEIASAGSWGHDGERARLDAVAGEYRDLARRYRTRSSIYAARDASARWSAYRRLRRERGYDGALPWSFGRGAIVGDLALGVPFGPALTRLETWARSAKRGHGDERAGSSSR